MRNINVVGCCTDNTAANKQAWDLLYEKYPGKFFYGCTCHVLYLLVHDIVNILPWISLLETNCRSVVKIIKKSGLLSASVNEMLAELNLNRFTLAGETRWGSVLSCFERVHDNYIVLKNTVGHADFVESAKTAELRGTRTTLMNAIR